VYLATDTKLNRKVALKVLPAAALGSEEDRARFFREAQAASRWMASPVTLINPESK
jgi:serine/threonine protein kinase